MTTLALDIGNTKLAAAVLDADLEVLATWRSARAGEVTLGDALAWLAARTAGADLLALANVVPAEREAVARAWTGPPLVVVDHTRARFPFAGEHPETVGADRWCNVAWAWHQGVPDAVVADLGSAHTYDVLREGTFVGGLIAPGAGISHDALVARGAQLPGVPFGDPGPRVGRHTVEAIQAGSFQQGGAGVAGVLAMLRAEVPGASVFVTGGLSGPLAGFLPADAVVDPWLTLRGAAVLARGAGPRSRNR